MTHTPNHPEKLAHSIDEATEFVPFGKSTMRKFVNSGELKSFKVGDLRIIGHDTLVKFVQKLEAAGYTPIPQKNHTKTFKG